MLASPARADDVARVGLGNQIRSLLATADGGAAITIQRVGQTAIGRAGADGSFRTASANGLVGTGAIGPDGEAWFLALGPRLLRSSLAGLTSVDIVGADDLGEGLATGPDGTLWTTLLERPSLVRITPQGSASSTPFTLAPCERELFVASMVPASDGAVWASDLSCSRLIRFAPDGARAVFPLGDQFVDQMAADTVGGVWHLGSSRVVENVDSAGRATRVEVGGERATDVAVAPDGSVWLALGRCAIARVNGAALEFRRIPIPAQHIAFDPAGRVWLASRTRLVHSALDQLGGTCDNRGPQVRVMPGTGRRVRLGALHRAGALRLRVSEPAVLSGFAQFGEGRLVNVPERRIYRRNGGAIGVRVTGERLRRIERRLAAGRRTTITVSWDAVDREGNEASETVAMRVVR